MIYELERGACGFYLIHACARVVVAPSSLLRKHDMTDKEMAESIMRNEYETLIDKGFEGSWQVYQSAWIKATSYADYIHTCMPPAIAQPVQPTNWQPIETARRGKKLIVGYFNKLGNWRTVMACYYEPRTLNCDDDNIADEDGYAPEGWYEESETQETILPTDEPPTHWMQLPSAPDKANIAQPVQPAVALIEECRAALAEELAGLDIDPPLQHVKQAHDRCVEWLARAAIAQPVQPATESWGPGRGC